MSEYKLTQMQTKGTNGETIYLYPKTLSNQVFLVDSSNIETSSTLNDYIKNNQFVPDADTIVITSNKLSVKNLSNLPLDSAPKLVSSSLVAETANTATNATSLGGVDASNFALKSDVIGVYRYKGSVKTFEELPTSGLNNGDVYNVEKDGMNYAYVSSVSSKYWDSLGTIVDLENASSASIADSLNLSSTVGNSNTPVYFALNGKPVACTPYSSAYVLYASSAGVANSFAVSSSIGNINQPVYINSNGIPTACASYDEITVYNASNAFSANYATIATTASTALTIGTETVGNTSTPVYISSGVPVSCVITSEDKNVSSSIDNSSIDEVPLLFGQSFENGTGEAKFSQKFSVIPYNGTLNTTNLSVLGDTNINGTLNTRSELTKVLVINKNDYVDEDISSNEYTLYLNPLDGIMYDYTPELNTIVKMENPDNEFNSDDELDTPVVIGSAIVLIIHNGGLYTFTWDENIIWSNNVPELSEDGNDVITLVYNGTKWLGSKMENIDYDIDYDSLHIKQFSGSTYDKDGTSGLVPKPTKENIDSVLVSNGKWETIGLYKHVNNITIKDDDITDDDKNYELNYELNVYELNVYDHVIGDNLLEVYVNGILLDKGEHYVELIEKNGSYVTASDDDFDKISNRIRFLIPLQKGSRIKTTCLQITIGEPS